MPQGWFSDTVPGFASRGEPISLLHIDCDLYTSTKDCLPFLQPNVSNGGAVVFDDYNDGGGGEKRAFRELGATCEAVVLGPAPQVYYIRGAAPAGQQILQDGQIRYVLDDLLANEAYLSWLRDRFNWDYAEELRAALA